MNGVHDGVSLLEQILHPGHAERVVEHRLRYALHNMPQIGSELKQRVVALPILGRLAVEVAVDEVIHLDALVGLLLQFIDVL